MIKIVITNYLMLTIRIEFGARFGLPLVVKLSAVVIAN